MWATLKQKVWQWRWLLFIAPSVATCVIVLRLSGLLQLLEWAAFDQMFRSRPSEPMDSRIAIVGLTEADLRRIGQVPIPDGVLAQALRILSAQQPRAIGLDLYRDLPVEPGHQELVQVFTSTPNLIGAEKVIGDDVIERVAPPPTLQERDQVSAVDLVVDADGKVRRALLYLNSAEGQLHFGMGFRLALKYLEVEGIQPELTKQDWIQLGQTIIPPLEPDTGGYVRTNVDGYQILINYRGAPRSFETVSLSQVLDRQIPDDWARDRIIFIGATAESLRDYFQTPFGARLIASPELMAGVEVHANITSQLLSSVLSERSLIQTWTDPEEWLWIFLWSCVGTIVGWNMGYASGLGKRSLMAFTLFLTIGGLFGIGYLAFWQGWWLPVVPAAIALLTATGVVTAVIAQTANRIRRAFSRYLTSEIVAQVLETPGGLNLGGEHRVVTILLSDLRGFSSLCERLQPAQVVTMLNVYFEQMVDIITHYNGIIDEFIGDAILVVFGIPTEQKDDAERAVACAIAMQLAMEPVNHRLQEIGLPHLEMGIGINTGEVVAGNIGSQKRTKYSVIGRNVNRVARIESYTVGGQILISESTLKANKPILQINRVMTVELKGIAESLSLYELTGIQGQYQLSLPTVEMALFPLAESMPMRYFVLTGKRIMGEALQGWLVKLSERAAEAKLESPVAPLSDLKITIPPDAEESDGSVIEEIYAKVLAPLSDDGLHVQIRFTVVPPAFEALVRSFQPL
jgi:adenylate cyclase